MSCAGLSYEEAMNRLFPARDTSAKGRIQSAFAALSDDVRKNFAGINFDDGVGLFARLDLADHVACANPEKRFISWSFSGYSTGGMPCLFAGFDPIYCDESPESLSDALTVALRQLATNQEN